MQLHKLSAKASGATELIEKIDLLHLLHSISELVYQPMVVVGISKENDVKKCLYDSQSIDCFWHATGV